MREALNDQLERLTAPNSAIPSVAPTGARWLKPELIVGVKTSPCWRRAAPRHSAVDRGLRFTARMGRLGDIFTSAPFWLDAAFLDCDVALRIEKPLFRQRAGVDTSAAPPIRVA
jgi:hypothetical protein